MAKEKYEGIRRDGGWLNLTDANQRSSLLSKLGGNKFFEDFPLFGEAFKKAADEDISMYSESENTTVVDYMTYETDTKQLHAHILGFFPEELSGSGLVEVLDEHGKTLEKKTFDIDKQKFCDSTVAWNDFDIDAYLNQILKAQFSITASNNDGTLRAGVFSLEIIGYELKNNIVKQITVNDPVHKGDKNADVRVIQYARYGVRQTGNDSFDYDYRDVQTVLPDKKNDIFLDFSGSVNFLDTLKVFKGLKTGASQLHLYSGDGSAYYDMKSYETYLKKCFKATNSGFSWNLDITSPSSTRKQKLENVDWHVIMPRKFAGAKLSFSFITEFIYGTKDSTVDNKYQQIVISTDETVDKENEKRMPYMRFFVGCLGPDTMVTMKDGSQKAISKIQKGESVKTPTGSTIVLSVTTGYEYDDMYNILVEGRDEYTAITGSHVVHTREGLIPLSRMKIGDEIMKEDGTWHALEELFPVAGGAIYNLQLEEHGEFYADGLCVGDFDAQNNYVAAPKSRASKELMDEAHRLAEYLSGGRQGK